MSEETQTVERNLESTLSGQLRRDARWQTIKEQARQLLEAYQQSLTGPKPPADECAVDYEKLIQAFGEIRGGKLYYPYIGSGLGRGALVELIDGSVKYDLISGIGVHGLGHGVHAWLDASLEASLDDVVMQGNLQQNDASRQFASRLLALAKRNGAPLAHCFLTSSGAMANENALKLAFHAKGTANRLIAFENAFAGRTICLSSVTDRPAYRKGLPEGLRVDYIPFCDPERPQESRAAALSALNRLLERHPGAYGGLWIELVQGEGGYYTANREFFTALFTMAREYDVPIIIDEVQTFGRTQEPFAFQTYGLDDWADIVTVGKMSQVCATLFKPEFKPQPGIMSQTFTGASAAIRAGLAVLDYFERDGVFGPEGEVVRLRQAFDERFHRLMEKHPDWITGLYGTGTLIAFTPFQGELAQVKELLQRLFEAGIIAFLNGKNPARIRFLPPLGCLQEDDLDWIFATLERVLHEYAEQNS